MTISPARSVRSRGEPWCGWTTVGLVTAAAFGLAGAVGCASPGPPRPPTLSLPAVVGDLSAERVGDNVVLRWTASAETTDGLPVGDRAMTAELCRERGSATAGQAACLPVARLAVSPGPSSATDVLPGPMVGGRPEMLAYRVRLLNGAGRAAGWSGVAISAGGAAPPPVSRVEVRPTERGAEITWAAEPGAASFEMERVAGEGPASAGAAGKNAKGAAAAKKAAKEVRLLVPGKSGGSDADGTGDPGGALDPGAAVGETYVYRVQRVRTVAVGGHTVAVRGPMSEPVEVRMRDVFPPGAPTGLAGIPACVEGKLGVDLSWEANGESDLAGYFVYRAEGLDGAAWTKRMERPERPLEAPAFRDPDVGGGGVRYRVTAVDRAGNESAPSAVFSVAGEELRSVSCPAPR